MIAGGAAAGCRIISFAVEDLQAWKEPVTGDTVPFDVILANAVLQWVARSCGAAAGAGRKTRVRRRAGGTNAG